MAEASHGSLQSLVHPQEPSDPILESYWPSERRAILRFFVSFRDRCTGELAEVVEHWEDGACRSWRRAKMRLDGQKQLEEIEQHKYLVSKELGYDIGWDQAAEDWIANHAKKWRDWWEFQPESNPEA